MGRTNFGSAPPAPSAPPPHEWGGAGFLLLLQVDDAQGSRARVRAEDAADLADGDLLVGKLGPQVGGDSLRVLLSLGVHHRDVLHRLLRPEELDHARDRARARAHAVDRLDLGVLRNEQERLHVEHRPDHGLGSAEPAAHLQVAKSVEEREHPALEHALLDGLRRLLERRAFRRDATEERDRHRDRLAVDDVDGETLDLLSADPGRFRGGREPRADVDRDASVVVLREAAVDVSELAGRRRRRRGQRARRGEANKELLARHVDLVAKRLLAEEDFEWDDLDLVAVAPLGGQVGSRVGDDREGTGQKLFDGEDEGVVLLAALLDLDLQARIARADLGLELSHLVVAGLLAAVDRDELVGVRAELAERLVDDLCVVAAGELEPVVDEADHVALLDAQPVGARVAHRVRDLDRLHAFRLRLHRAHVLLGWTLGPEGDHGGNALRNAVRLDDLQLLFGQADDLLRRGDDVAVVGQQDDLVVGNRFDRGQHVLRAGVHGLAALDDRVDAEAAKDVDQPASGDYHGDADSVGPRRSGDAGAALVLQNAPVLRRHVADVELHQLAVAARQVDDARGVVGVDVHLDQLWLPDHQYRVAERLDLVADEVGVQVRALDEELGAVAPAAFRQRERDLRRDCDGPGFGERGKQRLRLLDRLQHSLEDELQTEASSVDHAGVAQDLELAGRLQHGGASARGGRRDDARDVGVGAARRRRGGAAGLARDGEDGALRRLVDRAVGGVGRLFERGGELRRSERALTFDRARESAEDLREDHTRVAARAHQAAVRRELRDLADLGGVRLFHVLDRRLEGEQHVGAGVAVRDRADVEPVDLFVVGREPAQAAQQRALEELTVHSSRLCRGHHSAALLADALHVDVDLDDGHVDGALDLELHRVLEVVRDLRDPYPVLDDDVDVDHQAFLGLDDVDALVHVLAAQQFGEPVAQAAAGHAADAVAARGRVARDGGDRRREHLDAAPLPGLDERGGGGLGGH